MSTVSPVLTALLAALLSAVFVGGLGAQDRVMLRPPDSAGTMTIGGDIIGYNSEVLTLRTRGPQGVETYAARNVLAVETFRTPAHLAGLKAFEAGQFDEALSQFEKGLSTEQRVWMRNELIGGIIRCHQRRNEYPLAVIRFVEIILNEPLTRQWELAPLPWGSETISDDLKSHARRWLLHKSEAVRLVGSSVLLNDPVAKAQKELESLSRSQDRYVNSLARAQLWRIALEKGQEITPLQLDRWRRDVERMPEGIRGGPWYLIGQGWLRQSEPDQASAVLLRVFLIHSGNEPLAARAGLDAALALSRLNRNDEADAIYREIVERFHWTTFATEARTSLESSNGT